MACQEYQEAKETREIQDLLDHKVFQDELDLQDLKVTAVVQATLAWPVLMALVVSPAGLGVLVLPVVKDCVDYPAAPACPV